MEPVYQQGFEPENRRYTSHFDFMQKNSLSILKCYLGAIVFWTVCLLAVKVIRDWRMN